jgi:hypothetical protein
MRKKFMATRKVDKHNMTNNKQQTEMNAVEYLDKVNQFAKENNTGKPRQQTAVEWFHQKTWALKIQLEKGEISIGEYANTYATLYEQAKEMEKEKAIKLYIDYRNYLHEEFKHQNGGQAVILSFREFYEQTYGGGEQ